MTEPNEATRIGKIAMDAYGKIPIGTPVHEIWQMVGEAVLDSGIGIVSYEAQPLEPTSDDLEKDIMSAPLFDKMAASDVRVLAGTLRTLGYSKSKCVLGPQPPQAAPSPEKPTRKVVSIAKDGDVCLALCNDGTIWYALVGAPNGFIWNQIPPIPQEPTT